jgi:hypothetical protein
MWRSRSAGRGWFISRSGVGGTLSMISLVEISTRSYWFNGFDLGEGFFNGPNLLLNTTGRGLSAGRQWATGAKDIKQLSDAACAPNATQ